MADEATPTQEKEKLPEVQLLAREIAEAAERCSGTTLREIDNLKLKTEENYAAAVEQIQSNLAVWRSLLDEKEAELCQTVEEIRASKLAAFAEKEAMFTEHINQAKKLVADLAGSKTASQELLDQGHSLLASLSFPISPHHSHLTAHPGLGFCSNIKEYIVKALSMGMWVSGEDVKVGERVVVSAVGGLQPNGTFWVRRVTDNPWKLEYALQFISDSLFEVPQTCEPLKTCSTGQLCVGQFSQDGRWYRAVVISLPQPGVAKYFFLDHGGSEEAPVSSLYPLPDHFRALPFQMIHVRLTTDTSINFNTREMRWCFTDSTHNKHLVADILGRSEVDEAGPVYLIHLEDHTQEQPFDVGKILVTAARVKESTTKFKSRDVRFKDQRESAVQATPTTTTANEIGQPTGEESGEPLSNEVVQPSQRPNGHVTSNQPWQPPEPAGDDRGGGGVTDTSAPPTSDATTPHTITEVTPSPLTHSISPPPPPHITSSSTSSSQTAPPHSDSSPPLHTPSPDSPPTQSTVHTDGDTSLDTVPESDSGRDTDPISIPPDGSPDSIPPRDIPRRGLDAPERTMTSQTSSKDVPVSDYCISDEDLLDSPDSIPPAGNGTQTAVKPKPLQLGEVEGVLLSNAGVSNGNDAVEDDTVEAVDSIHPSVKTGELLEVEVVTELCVDGGFWCQLLLPSEGASYDRLQEELQAGTGRGEDEAFTPVFYHEGELCAARFSEDQNWYRARIERVSPGAPHITFTVRYVDFGNYEERQQHELIPLRSKFKLLPPRAIHCNIATTEHATFTQAQCERFDDLTSKEGISVKVLSVEGDGVHLVRVRLLQSLPDSDPVDITEQILSAGKQGVKSLPRRQWSSSTDMDTQNIGHVADWASHMEDQAEDSVFLTLPGHESRETTPLTREATPTNDLTSAREATPTRPETTNQKASLQREPVARETTPTRRREVTPREATPTRKREATPRETTPTRRREVTPREATPTRKREATPRETTPTLSTAPPAIQREATPSTRDSAPSVATVTSTKSMTPQREATPTNQEATPTQWAPLMPRSSNFLQRVPPSNRDPSRPVRQVRLDVNRAKHSIISSLGGVKTVPRPPRHDNKEGSPNLRGRARHSKQDHGKLYVRCSPEDMSDSKIRELFGCYGDVLDLDPHTTDPSVVYVTMDMKGAEEVVARLHGHQTSPGHHLVVEKYRNRSPSPPPPPSMASGPSDLSGVDHIKLFVKNMSADHNLPSLKTVFSRFGTVLKMVPDPKRKNVTYIFMEPEGGAKAINHLHGKAISKNGKPLVVEPSYEPRNR